MATLYTSGQIALPEQLCQRLGITTATRWMSLRRPGASSLTPLTPVAASKYEARIITDTVTGLPVITLGPDAPVLTSEQVAEMLKDFP